MDFRILGPLEVLDQGRRVSVRRGKEQALLAYLLLHANELVASDRLVDELWGERPPPTAAKILQNAVSQLRKALGDDRLLTRPPGYFLRVEPGELDLERFEVLTERGRAEGDPALLREALELWRGEPLADLRDEPFAQRASLQLEEARLAAHEDRLDADLAEGRDAELVPELEGLITEHPFDERLYRQLMLALYRAGRPGNALEVYQRARKTFDEQLGLQPGPELEELQRQILNQDDRLSAPARTPARTVAASRRRPRLMLVSAVALLGAALLTGLLLWNNGGDGTPEVVPNSLVKLDPDTGKVLDVIDVGRQPVALAVVGDAVWVSNNEDETVTRVDPKTGHTDTIGGTQASARPGRGRSAACLDLDGYVRAGHSDRHANAPQGRRRPARPEHFLARDRRRVALGDGDAAESRRPWDRRTDQPRDGESRARSSGWSLPGRRQGWGGRGLGDQWSRRLRLSHQSRRWLGRTHPDRAYARGNDDCVRFHLDHRRRGTRHRLETEP